MKLRNGFALLEVLFAMIIGSMLSFILFQSIGSMSKTYQKIFSVSSVQRRFTLVQQQFERDFSGITAPRISLEDERDPEKREKDESENEKKEDKKAEVKTGEEKTKQKIYRVPHVFFSKNDDKGNCVQLTCLTTNPVSMYGQQTPRLVRVVYRLEPDPEHKGLFLLARQQSDNLDFKVFEDSSKDKIRKFTISDNIEKLKISFLISKEPEKESELPTEEEKKLAEKEKKKDKKQEREFKTVTDWPYFEDEKEEEKSKRPSYPTFIKVEITLIDEQKRSSDFLLWYAPLYDIGPKLVDKSATLPSMSELYHRRFMEQRQQDMYSMQHAMRKQDV